MTYNYYLEFRFIPGLLEEVKQGRAPLQALMDIRWMKETLSQNNIDIDWDSFSVDVYDGSYEKTTLEKGKFIAYTFPPITMPPDAKYGVIDIEKNEYYTFESDFANGSWAIGNQDVNRHSLIEMLEKDMSLEEFMKYLNRSKTPFVNNPRGCLSVMLLAIVVATVMGFIS